MSELTSIPSEEEDLGATMVDDKPMAGVTVQELEAMIKQYSGEKLEVEKAEDAVKKLKAIQIKTERKLLAFLEEFDKTSYKCNWGTLVRTGRWSWKTPKTPEAKAAFYGYLQEQGVYDEMISVNSNTLASYAKKEQKAAEERQDVDFVIPGLDEPNYTERVSLRKA